MHYFWLQYLFTYGYIHANCDPNQDTECFSNPSRLCYASSLLSLNAGNSYPDLVHSLLVLLVSDVCINRIILYSVHTLCFFSSAQSVRGSFRVLHVRVAHTALLLCNILLYKCTAVCYFYCWWASLLPVSVIENKATMDIYSFSLWCVPGIGLVRL